MIPYGKQCLDKSDIDAVVKALKSPFLTQGPKVLEFENALAKYCGSKYAIAVSNGTAALHLAYLVAGLKEGDEVITTPNTFVATSNMLLAVGVKPVFCDIRLDTYNIDETKIEGLITKKTKAIAPVHFAGGACEMDTILKIAKKYKLKVIEDGCHALGSVYKKKPIGGIGDMTVMSFHAVKAITTGEGGAILTNSKKSYDRLLSLRSHGIHKDKKGFNVMTEMGYNYRITDIQCALGLSQLERLPYFVEKRRVIVKKYEKLIGGIKEIILPIESENVLSGWHVYVIRTVKEKDRFPLYNFLKEKGIGVNFHYPAVYSHPYYRKNGYAKTKLKNTDLYHKTAITLPIHPLLSDKDINFIAKTLKDFFKKD